MKINFNTVLVILGSLGVFAPDVAGLAAWLSSLHVGWLAYVVRALGLVAAFFAAAPLVVPRLRTFLALFGLATPPGERAPWDPVRDRDQGSIPTSINDEAITKIDRIGKITVFLLVGGAALISSTAFAQVPSRSTYFSGFPSAYAYKFGPPPIPIGSDCRYLPNSGL